jgi:hypothetical protein
MNDWVGGFDPYAKGIEIMANSLNTVIEQLDSITARVDELEDNLKFYGHSINNVEILTKSLSHDLHQLKTDALITLKPIVINNVTNLPDRFKDIANGE